MKRIKIKDRVLPSYTKGEEIINTSSHIIGAVLGIIATCLCIVFASIHHNVYGIISGAIYGITMTLLYMMSSIYHGLKTNTTSRKVFQIIDHCTIFLLIAGSYTPFTLCTFREYDSILGWSLFAIVWGLAVIGIILNSIDLHRYKVISMICYLVMGWCVVFKGYLLPSLLGDNGFWLLLIGGIIYTIGAIFYGLGRNIKYMHSIFHILIVIASLLQFLCIILYVM
ncbi:MAG: hemolysin III family protein [Clostridia bacterium]|nr:hemolysin III family protein [Clostridia bacterium]